MPKASESGYTEYDCGSLTSDDCIICPYCKELYVDDLFDGGEPRSWRCDECKKEFKIEVSYTAHFTAVKQREGTAT